MKPTLHIQEQTAEKLYRDSYAKHPRSARTTSLWCNWVRIKAKLIALQTREVQSKTSKAEPQCDHHTSGVAA